MSATNTFPAGRLGAAVAIFAAAGVLALSWPAAGGPAAAGSVARPRSDGAPAPPYPFICYIGVTGPLAILTIGC